MIEINVNGSVVSVQTTEALYCGSQDVHTCKFIFGTSWESFSKSAVFRVNGKTITVLVDADNSCILPWELLVRGNIGQDIEVGLYGVSADAEVLTSVWDSLGTVREGSELGSDAREPSAGVYEQVMSNVRRVDEKVDNYNTEVQTQVQRAESAASSALGSAESAAESETVAKNSADAAVNAKTAVESALNNLPAGSTLVINDLTTGGTTAALSAEMGKVLGRRPNPNLLDNWYFANPVNQRGITTVSGPSGYMFDRWTASTTASTTVSVDGNGMTIVNNSTSGTSYVRQYFEVGAIPPGVYTMSVLAENVVGKPIIVGKRREGDWTSSKQIVDGLTSHTVAVDVELERVQFQIPAGASLTIKAVKLEPGRDQTLAHQDASGNWVLDEIPDYKDELLKCRRSTADSNDTYANQPVAHGHFTNPNLLHNGYFANPVDQRGQTLTIPGAPYFDAAGTQIGVTSSYHTVIGRSGTGNPICSIDGENRFISKNYEIRGYISSGYTIDRWRLTNVNGTLTIDGDGCSLFGRAGNIWLQQHLENPGQLYGKRVTLSVLVDGNLHTCSGMVQTASVSANTAVCDKVFTNGAIGFYKTSSGGLFVQLHAASGKTVKYQAVKLELGDTQTLAHQDASGNWVLNEIPDNGAELAKCQRYQIKLNNTVATGYALTDTRAVFVIPLPTSLRGAPQIVWDGTIRIEGTWGGGDNGKEVTQLTYNTYTHNSIKVFADTTGLTAGQGCTLACRGTATILIDANL